MGALGLTPILIAAVGKDFEDYNAWLVRHGVNTEHVRISQTQYTATFMVTTDLDFNQIASFFPGAMSEAREIELAPIAAAVGGIDLLIVSPDDPAAMLRHSEAARTFKIPFAADPSQQLARMDGPEIKDLIRGAKYLFLNEYELALVLQKTGWSDAELFDQVAIRVITMGSRGSRIEEHGRPTLKVPVPAERAKVDPTGVGDAYRAGFMAGLSWGFGHERCAQLGSMLATYCLESTGTQEYRFTSEDFLARFSQAYGVAACQELTAKFQPRLLG
jgi:adenosine kinase